MNLGLGRFMPWRNNPAPQMAVGLEDPLGGLPEYGPSTVMDRLPGGLEPPPAMPNVWETSDPKKKKRNWRDTAQQLGAAGDSMAKVDYTQGMPAAQPFRLVRAGLLS